MLLLHFYTFLGVYTYPKILSYFYSFFIFILLVCNPLYYFINNNDINNIGFIVYKLNYCINYIFLCYNFNKIITYKYLDNINFYRVLLILQFVLLGIYISYILITYKLNILFSSNYTIINILIYISEFYGLYAYINNILFFILIFIKLFQDIYIINDELDNNIEHNNKKGLILFFYKIVDLKNTVTYTIGDFNYILNIFTLINLFSLGLVYHIYNLLNYEQKIYFFIITGYFCIIEVLCLGIILLISIYREDIFNKIYNPLFVNNFIKKYDINTFNDLYEVQLDINNINVNDITLFNILEENSTSIDWIILNITLNSKWVNFDLFGIEIHSLNSINQIIIIIAIFYKIML